MATTNSKEDDFKKLIVEAVAAANGIKSTELVCHPSIIRRAASDDGAPSVPDLIDELVSEGRLIEIEFVLPHMKYRIKSFLLPAGTDIKIRGA